MLLAALLVICVFIHGLAASDDGECNTAAALEAEPGRAALESRVRRLEAERAALLRLVSDPKALRGGDARDEELGDDAIGVRRSQIPGAGRGAFARRAFAAGERVGQYKCEALLRTDPRLDWTRAWALNATHSCDGTAFPLRYRAAHTRPLPARLPPACRACARPTPHAPRPTPRALRPAPPQQPAAASPRRTLFPALPAAAIRCCT